MKHETDETGYSRDGVVTPDVAFARGLARVFAEEHPKSHPKALIDAYLTAHRYHSILSQESVVNLLLDLRAEV